MDHAAARGEGQAVDHARQLAWLTIEQLPLDGDRHRHVRINVARVGIGRVARLRVAGADDDPRAWTKELFARDRCERVEHSGRRCTGGADNLLCVRLAHGRDFRHHLTF